MIVKERNLNPLETLKRLRKEFKLDIETWNRYTDKKRK